MANDQDTLHADLSELLTILGMGDHARPQSPHEVFQEALSVLRLRLASPQQPTGTGDPDRPVASGIEAATADETRSGSAEGKSPVNEVETPDYPSPVSVETQTEGGRT
ncbi:hypothetical protein [Methylobacterium thuringiense]|uniref:Uncharacterized protein n=1 Tax=Methylobacterium thuringiense TaxID=1003091 RepID=A0ABQ4TKZ7_9HYPH|nr:hypothetical protein [Methylobacterium thuringiense]GJE55242.1 hypothetical protein EKPJFOCH_1731 [Methylobacterium thuringiense]